MRSYSLRSPLLATSALLGLLAGSAFIGDPAHLSGAAACMILALAPGAALYLLCEREPSLLELSLAACVLSPVITATAGSLLILAGLSSAFAGGMLLAAVFALWIVALAIRPRKYRVAFSGRQLFLLLGTIVFLCVVVGYLPLAKSFWRYWSDAWFHNAVVAQIDAFGLPPTDPYFAGLDLQYMWAYHVLVLTLSKAARIDHTIVMTMINVQALAALVLATFAVSIQLKRRFAYGWFASITVIFGLNAVIWAFLPIKLIRAMTGNVTGWAEIVRNYTLVPFDSATTRAFFTIADNPTFLLDKFIIVTALGLGLALMAAALWGILVALSNRRPFAYVMVVTSVFGALVFHTVVGFVIIGAALGGLVALSLRRYAAASPTPGAIRNTILAIGLAAVLSLPYLYTISHLKESEFLLPVGLTFVKLISITTTCALVAVLALFQFRRLATAESPGQRFMFYSTIAMLVICIFLDLHGQSTNHKIPMFIFLMLAIIGSWTFAERFDRRYASAKYRRSILITAFALLMPVNVLSVLAFYNSPRVDLLSEEEAAVASWAQTETDRDALFFDTRERVFMLVAGPRQYYWGRATYAREFGYPKDIMDARRQVRDNLYSDTPLELATLRALGGLAQDVYVIVRSNESPGEERFSRDRDVFSRVFGTDGISVWKIDRAACNRRMQTAGR